MTAGRRPTPTALKVLTGTARPDRANPAEPKPPLLEIGDRPPAWITGARAKRAWTSLAPLLREQGLLTVLDAAALGLMVESFGDYLDARDLLEGKRCGLCGAPMGDRRPCSAPASAPAMEVDGKAGPSSRRHQAGGRYYTTRTETGSLMVRPHPAAAEKDAAWRRFVKLLIEFGATPAARSRVSAMVPASVDPAAEFLNGLG